MTRRLMAAVQLVSSHVFDGRALVLVGRDAAGRSVAIKLRDAAPYMWVRAQEGGGARACMAAVDAALREAKLGRASGEVGAFRRFYGYDPTEHEFVKVDLESPRAARGAREALAAHELAEADIDFATQACADLGVAPGGWFELAPAAQPADFGALTTVSFLASVADVRPRADLTGLAPLRVLSLDIETLTKDLGNGAVKFFDGSDADGRLVCVAACDARVGGAADARVVFCLDPDAPASGAPREEEEEEEGGVLLRWFADESALLRALAAHVRKRDPDFITGWNTDGFDFEWLAAAARRLGVTQSFWAGFSRFKGRDNAASHAEADDATRVRLRAPGRVPYDLMQWMKKNRQLERYDLEFVARTYGCGQKDDVEYAQIGDLFRTPEGRVRLAKYCEQDAALVLRLLATKELDPIGKDMALCAITGNFPAGLLARGTQHTLRCKMLRVAHARGFVLPYVPRREHGAENDDDDAVGYRGGMVLTAASGRYTDPVAVFDFASLYPSCMEERNTCASTRLTRARAAALGVAATTPPAPSLTGRWRRGGADIDIDIDDDWRTGVVSVDGAPFRYESDVCAAIVNDRGERAVLVDGGYGLRWDGGGAEWARAPEVREPHLQAPRALARLTCFPLREPGRAVLRRPRRVHRPRAAAGGGPEGGAQGGEEEDGGRGGGGRRRARRFLQQRAELDQSDHERSLRRLRRRARRHLPGRPGDRVRHHGHRPRLDLQGEGDGGGAGVADAARRVGRRPAAAGRRARGEDHLR